MSFECKYCGKKFEDKWVLSEHLFFHREKVVVKKNSSLCWVLVLLCFFVGLGWYLGSRDDL